MEWVLLNWPYICASVAGAIVVVDRIVAWTPMKKDDLVWTPIKKGLRAIIGK